jgi:CRP/FNR family transcriptional regulator, cyclic AMP receptor protein
MRLNPRQKLPDISPLDRVGWLADEPQPFRDWAASVARIRDYQPGQFIFQAGDTSDGIHGLASGGVDLHFPLIGDEPVLFHRAEIGFWIGDSAELGDHKRTISLVAASPTRMVLLPRHEVRMLLANDPSHWRSFYQLSDRNGLSAMAALAESLALTVRARICRKLLVLTERDPNVEITQEDLARLVGVARATLRRSIAELVAEGGVETGYRSLRVVDRVLLERHRHEQ